MLYQQKAFPEILRYLIKWMSLCFIYRYVYCQKVSFDSFWYLHLKVYALKMIKIRLLVMSSLMPSPKCPVCSWDGGFRHQRQQHSNSCEANRLLFSCRRFWTIYCWSVAVKHHKLRRYVKGLTSWGGSWLWAFSSTCSWSMTADCMWEKLLSRKSCFSSESEDQEAKSLQRRREPWGQTSAATITLWLSLCPEHVTQMHNSKIMTGLTGSTLVQ